MRLHAIFLAASLVSIALAGCTGGDDAPVATSPATTSPAISDPIMTTPATTTPATTPPPAGPVFDSSTYALALVASAPHVKVGERLNLTLHVNGTQNATAQTLGAYFSANETPPASIEDAGACEQENGTLPGVHEIWCAFPEAGVWYVWGHASLDDAGETRQWWTSTGVRVEARSYTLTLSEVPTSASSGSAFSFTLQISGAPNGTTDHIGAHFFNDTASSTTEAQAGECQHTTGEAVGNHTLSCTIEHTGLPKEFYVRGHLRFSVGGVTLSWWSEPKTVTVSPLPANPLG